MLPPLLDAVPDPPYYRLGLRTENHVIEPTGSVAHPLTVADVMPDGGKANVTVRVRFFLYRASIIPSFAPIRPPQRAMLGGRFA